MKCTGKKIYASPDTKRLLESIIFETKNGTRFKARTIKRCYNGMYEIVIPSCKNMKMLIEPYVFVDDNTEGYPQNTEFLYDI